MHTIYNFSNGTSKSFDRVANAIKYLRLLWTLGYTAEGDIAGKTFGQTGRIG